MPSTVIPCLRYADAPKMIDWLCETLGFERKMVMEDGSGGVGHAELTLGGGMIMLGSAREDGFGKLQSSAQALGGNSQSAYVVVADADAAYAKVTAAGGEIVRGLVDQEYGSREFSLRDPEGVLWNVGTYDPWLD